MKLFMNVFAGNGGGSSTSRSGDANGRTNRKPTRDANQRTRQEPNMASRMRQGNPDARALQPGEVRTDTGRITSSRRTANSPRRNRPTRRG